LEGEPGLFPTTYPITVGIPIKQEIAVSGKKVKPSLKGAEVFFMDIEQKLKILYIILKKPANT
jgi:hypothetical protein